MLAFFTLLLSQASVGLSATLPDIGLSEQEQQWLRNNPGVTFTGDPNWLPFEAFNKKQVYIGIVSEHLHIIEQRLGM